MSIHICKCTHNGREEYHLRYPGMSQRAAQEIADKINGGALTTAQPAEKPEDQFCDGHCTWRDHHPDCVRAEKPEAIEQQNARFAIDGAIAYGRMGINKPPSNDHWLMPYWEIGRELATLPPTGQVAYCTACQEVGMSNCGNFDECGEPRCVTCHRPLNAQQVEKDAKRLLVEVCYIEDSDPFIYGIDGKINITALQELEDAIIAYQKEDEDSRPCKESGDYVFKAHYEKPQHGEFYRIEVEGYWGLTLVSFKPYPNDAIAQKEKDR